tara:strand:- start:1869 stop:2171 length:303 start_codon:yes stop_codon:yes gene_type:complete
MAGIGGCRSSGVLGASAIVSKDNAKLISLHLAITVNSGACTVKVFNGTDNSGTEIVRFHNEVNGFYNLEYDMHGVMCRSGIFLEITEAGSSTANVSVEFN